jgi:two-component system, NarL family, response regulator DesR
MPISILIADDSQIARTAIRQIITREGFTVCGEAFDGEDAVQKSLKLKPDVVLLDIAMPGTDGITAAAKIRRELPSAKIIFVTLHANEGYRAKTRFFEHAFISKANVATELIPTLSWLAETLKKPLSGS